MSARTSTRRAPLLTVYAALVFAFVYLPIVVLIL
jgi:ABC-type spermidine/putrescine transport system permease subunit II